MSTSLIMSVGHAYLPLVVHVKQNNLNINQFFVETYIANSFVDEVILNDETQARQHAASKFEAWAARLDVVFNAGMDAARAEATA